MNECYKCGISKDKTTLYEGVYKTGIVSVCRKCYFQIKIPLIEKKKVNWDNIDVGGSVRDRLEDMTHTKGFKKPVPREEFGLRTDDAELKQIVVNNFHKDKIVSKEESTGLVENFHWAIMRKRRSMKFTIGELSQKLREPEIVLESLEKGILPRDYESLIKKIEVTLDLKLFSGKGLSINSNTIINESKVPTGIMVSEVKPKTPIKNFFFGKKDERSEEEILREKVSKELSVIEEDEFNPEELSLETINEIVGEPVVAPKIEKIPFEPRYEDTNSIPAELNVESRESRVESKTWSHNVHKERPEEPEYWKAPAPRREEPAHWSQKSESTEASRVMDEIRDKILEEKTHSQEVESMGESRIPENVRLAMAELEAEKERKTKVVPSSMSEEEIRRLAWGK